MKLNHANVEVIMTETLLLGILVLLAILVVLALVNSAVGDIKILFEVFRPKNLKAFWRKVSPK